MPSHVNHHKDSNHHPVISCQNLIKTFSLGKERADSALKGIDLDIYSHELVILHGPSGSGKSTLLNLIAGLERPTQGTIKIRSKNISDYNQADLALHHRTKIGMVFQQFNLIPKLSVIENVTLPQVFADKPPAIRLKRAHSLLKLFNLDKYANNAPTELSGGEQQRVAIARALANNPWILLFDEPTGNLDTKSGKEVIDLIVRLNRQSKRTILLVTHNPEYLHIADRIVYLRDGKIVRQEKQRKSALKGAERDHFSAFSEEHMEKTL